MMTNFVMHNTNNLFKPIIITATDDTFDMALQLYELESAISNLYQEIGFGGIITVAFDLKAIYGDSEKRACMMPFDGDMLRTDMIQTIPVHDTPHLFSDFTQSISI